MTVVERADMSACEARAAIDEIRRDVDGLIDRLNECWERRAWIALGYRSWAEMCAAEFPNRMLPREERRALVADLRANGMSTRAIEAATGASHGTVVADLAGGQIRPPAVSGLDGRTYPTRPLPVDEPLPFDPEEDARRARREAIERDAERLRKFISGWFTFSTLETNPDRDDVLDALAPPDLEQLTEITGRITWTT